MEQNSTHKPLEKSLLFFYFLAFSLLAFCAKSSHYIIVYFLAMLAVFFPARRTSILTANNVIAFFVLNPFFLYVPARALLISFILFTCFNAVFLITAPRKILSTRPLLSMLFVGTLIAVTYQSITEGLAVERRRAFALLHPILFSFWSYCSNLQRNSNELNFFYRVLWLRPFWYTWILPFGTQQEAARIALQQTNPEITARRLRSDLKNFSFFIVAYTIFENLFFSKTYRTYDLGIVRKISALPNTYRDGFQEVLSGAYSGAEAFFAQFISTIHFLGGAYFYTTLCLISVSLSGGDIHPHTTAFWKAKSFSDFCFRTGYHYAMEIQRSTLRPLFSLLAFIKNHSIRLFLGVFFAVYIVSAICLYLGRGVNLWMSLSIWERTLLFISSNTYSPLIGLLCAGFAILESRATTFGRSKKIRFLRFPVYILALTLVYIFSFHFLNSGTSERLMFLKKILGLSY